MLEIHLGEAMAVPEGSLRIRRAAPARRRILPASDAAIGAKMRAHLEALGYLGD